MQEGHYGRWLRGRLAARGDAPAFMFKRGDAWSSWTWAEVARKIEGAARAFAALGVEEGGRVGLFSPNRPEWTVADVGALTARCVPVPIYPTSTVRQAAFIVQDAAIEVLFAGGADHYAKARELMAQCPSLKALVVFDPSVPVDDDGKSMTFEAFLRLGEGEGAGREVEARLARGGSEDVLTIIYTSGTTGEPKGVVLTHASLMACFEAHEGRLPPTGPGDVSLCFLPLSHVFERCWTYYGLHCGMTNAYLEDPKQVAGALQEIRPTVMCAVPRFYEKIHGAVMARLQAAPTAKRVLFRWAFKVGAETSERRRMGLSPGLGLGLRHRLADRLVLKKIRDLTGGRVRFFPCAGAPLSPEIEAFFHAAGLFVAQGYGLTETTATVSVHEWRNFRFGTVGKPLPGVEVRIGEENEVQVRGATVMREYYRRPEETAAAFVDGWFRTGDAGEIDAEGRLVITDRLKDLFKTSGGKYVAPQAVETALMGDPLVEQVAVIGDRRKFVTALVVPNFAALEEWAASRGVVWSTREDLLAHPEVHAVYERRIARRTADMAPHEHVKRFTLLDREFSQEDGELTPTLKVRRKEVAERYNEVIEAMYEEAPCAP